MTETVEIKIQKVWPPFPDSKIWKDGKKRGKIVTAAGAKYQVAETILRQFNDGDICKVEVKKFGDKDNPGLEIVGRIDGTPQSNGHTHFNKSPQPSEIIATNPCASVFGMVNAFISIGCIAADGEAGGNLIDKCEQMFLNSKIGKRSIGG